MKYISCPQILQTYYAAFLDAFKNLTMVNLQAQSQFLELPVKSYIGHVPSAILKDHLVDVTGGNIFCGDDIPPTAPSEALASLFGVSSLCYWWHLEYLQPKAIGFMFALISFEFTHGMSPNYWTIACDLDAFAEPTCEKIYRTCYNYSATYKSNFHHLLAQAQTTEMDILQMNISLVQYITRNFSDPNNVSLFQINIFDTKDTPWAIFGWCYLYEWVIGEREVVSFEGDYGTINTVSTHMNPTTMALNSNTIPTQLSYLCQQCAIYTTCVLMGVTGLVAFYAIFICRGDTEGLNFFEINRIAGHVWIGRPILFVRSLTALWLLNTTTLELVAAGAGTMLSLPPLAWYKTLLASSELTWLVYILNNLLSCLTLQWTPYYSWKCTLCTWLIAVIWTTVSPQQYEAKIDRQCEFINMDQALSCTSAFIQIGSFRRVILDVVIVVVSVATLLLAETFFNPKRVSADLPTLLLDASSYYMLDFKDWNLQGAFYLDQASAFMAGVLSFNWRDTLYLFNIKSWRLFTTAKLQKQSAFYGTIPLNRWSHCCNYIFVISLMQHEDDSGITNTIRSPIDNPWDQLREDSIPRLSAAAIPSITTAEALKGLQSRRELQQHFYNLPYPITLFCVFVIMMLTHTPIHRIYYVNHGLSVALAPDSYDAMDRPLHVQFASVRTIEDIEQWINNSVFPAVFTEVYYNQTIIDPSTTYRIKDYNKIVGALELSALNAEKEECPDGTLGGYYLGIGTREFHVKLTTYKGEHDMFTYMHFALEFGEGGGIEPTFHMATIPTNPYKSSRIHLTLDILVGLLVLRLIIRRVLDIVYRAKRHQRWIDEEAVIEWISIALLAAYYEAWYQLCKKFFLSGFDEKVESLREFYDKLYKMTPAEQVIAMETSPQPVVSDFIDTLGPVMEFLYLMSIATCLQLAVNVMTALQFHPTMSILSNTIVSSVKRLGSFTFVFMLVVVALAASGCLLFGPQLEEYSSLGKALVTCINMIFVGGYEYENIQGINEIGVVWYWLCQSIITLVLVNIMLAVIIAAHEEIVQVSNQDRSFLYETWWMFDDFCRTTLMCRDKKAQRFEDCLVCDSLTRVWSTVDIAMSIGITPDQAAHWIMRIKQFPCLSVDSTDTRSSRSSLIDDDNQFSVTSPRYGDSSSYYASDTSIMYKTTAYANTTQNEVNSMQNIITALRNNDGCQAPWSYVDFEKRWSLVNDVERRCGDQLQNGAVYLESILRNIDIEYFLQCWGDSWHSGFQDYGKKWWKAVQLADLSVDSEVSYRNQYSISEFTTQWQNIKQLGVIETLAIQNS
ncbi:Polycystin Cation Channel (PCC) Family [Thraustotheca clavata]|uniref:Polycystin Cation Channel (PCC) Family n=1 Tax=Thraustotheca clavata TaxID=74557 RepID=A0A1V9Z939_9STRA|nr:Polycystin Cation Channel (PCC) Family [Thraustotheca clavata]